MQLNYLIRIRWVRVKKTRDDKNKITRPMADIVISVNRAGEQRAMSLMSNSEWVNNCMRACITL